MKTIDYEQFKIKEYDHWDLYLHLNQYPYLGRCYAWAKREDADLVTDMRPEETAELFEKILIKWDFAVKRLFDHDRSNVAILGNDANHLHAHLIPRYNTTRLFNEITFDDPNPKGNYAPYQKRKLPLETLLEIKNLLKKEI